MRATTPGGATAANDAVVAKDAVPPNSAVALKGEARGDKGFVAVIKPRTLWLAAAVILTVVIGLFVLTKALPALVILLNAICERFLGSVRRARLDHLLILHERQLYRVLRAYCAYFNTARLHQGIGQAIPEAIRVATMPHAVTSIVSVPLLGASTMIIDERHDRHSTRTARHRMVTGATTGLPRFTDFEEMAVRIAEKGPYLRTTIHGWRQEHGAARHERRVGSAAIRDTQRHLMADGMRIRWWTEGDRWLILGRPATRHQ